MISIDRISELIHFSIQCNHVKTTSDEMFDLTNAYSAHEYCMKKLKGHMCPVKCWSEDNGYEFLEMNPKLKIGWMMR